MTDNDDERMDRAKRIRRMREGDRDETDDTGDEGTETVADGEGADVDDTAEVDETDADESGDENSLAEKVQEAASAEADEETSAEPADEGAELDETAAEADEDAGGDEEATADDDSAADIAAKVQEAASAVAEPTESEPDAVTTDDGEDEDVSAPLPEMDELEEALEGSGAGAEAGGAPAGGGGATAQSGTATSPASGPDATASDTEAETEQEVAAEAQDDAPAPDVAAEATKEEETRVLEFALEGEYYCLDIAYIEEIVKEETITRVPNTPEWVEGVVDLRGQITTILNPKVPIGKDNTEPGDLIVVFDAEAFEDQGYIGWVVDDVRQVSPIVESEVNDPPMEEAYIEGVIDRDDDDQFVIWTNPDLVLEAAESEA